MIGKYIDGPFGQVHCRFWGEAHDAKAIVCLPPSPFSSRAYHSLAPKLAASRPVVAIDYPGYGNSAPCPGAPSINDYALAVRAVIQSLLPDQSADLLGFHTGCLVAVETSLIAAEVVDQLVLIDSPYFDPEKQAELFEKMAKPVELTADLDMLKSAWDFCVSKRLEHIPLPRAYEMFVDHITSGVDTNRAFDAAFQYDCKTQFQKVSHPTLVIATKAGLYEQTLNTAKEIGTSRLLELPDITTAVLEHGAEKIAHTVVNALAHESV